MEKFEMKNGHVIKCYESPDPENPGIFVTYEPKNGNFEIDLVCIEIAQMKPGRSDEDDIQIMVYDNVYQKKNGHQFIITNEDVKMMTALVNAEHSIVGRIRLEDTCDLTDPFYDKNVWCRHTVKDMLPGEYTCHCKIADFDSLGKRIVASMIIHEDYTFGFWERHITASQIVHKGYDVPAWLDETTQEDGPKCGVDSGLFGYFRDKPDCMPHEWNDIFCDAMQSEDGMCERVVLNDDSFITSSGFGDGGYAPKIFRNKYGKAVCILMEFVSPYKP